jgi:hypothetical protein
MTTLTETAEDDRTTAIDSPVVRFREVGKVYDDEGLRVTAIRSVTIDIPKKRFAILPAEKSNSSLMITATPIDQLR